MKWIRDQNHRFRLDGLLLRTAGRVLVTIVAVALVSASPSFAETGRVYPNAESVEPLAVGQSVPAVLVRSIDNEPFQLTKIARESGALLVFYRGGW